MLRASSLSLAAATAALFILAPLSQAQAVARFDLPAQPLATALRALGSQTSTNVLFDPQLVEGRDAPALKAELTLDQAFARLLAGTRLQYRFLDDKTVTVISAAGSQVEPTAAKPAERRPTAYAQEAGVPLIRVAQNDSSQSDENRRQPGADQRTEGDGREPSGQPAAEIQEVIVTAGRFSESLQKTALAIQAFSSDDIIQKGAVTPQEIARLVPGMSIDTSTFSTISFRGLGGIAANGFGTNAVAFNVDGIILSQQQAINGNFFDIERIEVLKGPQGTLYGRNASTGAINVITRNPTQEFGGSVNVELGNYDLRRINGAINVPLSDTFAVRGAIYSSERDGYLKDNWDQEEQLNGRIKALWTPNESFRTLLSYSESNVHGQTGANAPRPPPLGDYWLGPTDPLVAALRNTAGVAPANPDGFTDIINHMAYAQVDWDLSPTNRLTFIPAYGWGTLCNSCESLIIPRNQDLLGNQLDTYQLTGELRLAHTGDRVRYVTGLYSFKEHVSMTNLTYPNIAQGSSLQSIPNQDTDSYAAFGDLTYSLTDAFRLIGGLRYTHDKKTLVGEAFRTGPRQRIFGLCPDTVGIGDGIGPGITTGCSLTILSNERTSHRTNWKVGTEYDVTPNSFLFGTVATGYKGGIFYPGPPPNNLAEPEYMTAYTMGSRNRFRNNTLQINAELFYWDFKNQQLSAVGIDSRGALAFITYNAGASTIYGATVDVVWRITPRNMFRAVVEYDHAYYDEYVLRSPLAFSAGSLGGGCPQSTAPGGPFGTLFFADCSGKRMVRTPAWSGSTSYGHDFSLGGNGTLHAEVSGRFNSEQYLQQDWSGRLAADGSVLSKMPGYVVWDALLEYQLANRPWSVALWGRNLGDKVVFTAASSDTLLNSDLAPPRTYGLRFNVEF